MIKTFVLCLLVSSLFIYFGCNNNSATIVNNNNTGNFPPNVPTNPSPHDSAQIAPAASITLSWTGGDPDVGDTAKYDLYLDTSNPPMTRLASATLLTNYDLGAPASGLYFWKIIAKDKLGATTSGPVWRFTVNHP
jgi:hypothetical protein